MNITYFSRRESAISPIIATLLLILIAIASGVIIYVYVTGFVSNSTLNSGFSQEDVSIDSACLSVSSTHCNNNYYYIVIRNLGNTISYSSSPTIKIYFTDSATSASGSATCSPTPPNSISGGGSITCQGSAPGGFTPYNSGDSVVIKVVMPNGGAATYSVRVSS